MKSVSKKPRSLVPFMESDLFQLELLIAKRADRLRRRFGTEGGGDVMHWLRAEAEVIERYFDLRRPVNGRLAGGR